MNGVHDMGGLHAYFGPVEHDPDGNERDFAADWEKRTRAWAVVMMGVQRRFSWESLRHSNESQPPLDYLSRSYWERWLTSLEQLVVDDGLVTAEELVAGRSTGTPPAGPAATIGRWKPLYETDSPPRYRAGDHVRGANRHPAGHTREPWYVRGRAGVVVRYVGAEPLAERAAEHVCVPQNLYNVRFDAEALWGADATGRDAVYLDLFEDYLEPA
jgi:nitrile hydratase subunit beta